MATKQNIGSWQGVPGTSTKQNIGSWQGYPATGGKTTKNTRATHLGERAGQDFRSNIRR